MKQASKTLVFLSLILLGINSAANSCCDDCCEDCDNCTAVYKGQSPCSFLPRPQGWSADRELVGWQQFINKFEMEQLYGAFYATPGYSRSFKSCRIADYLFGPDYAEGKLTISGSRRNNRGENDWLADYFGLSPNFKSTVKFCPRISNLFVDLGLYLGLDEIVEGTFLKIHAPIVRTKWKLGMQETPDKTEATLGFDAGYMDSVAIPLTDLPEDFTAAIKGVTWGDMQEKLEYTTIDSSCCERIKTRFADIEVALGWNFLQSEEYHMGLMIRAAFPTGNKKCCKYIFEPVVGNGGFFELGGGLSTSRQLWASDTDEKSIWLYMDANVMHLFKKKLWRVFELKDRPNSRYMLVQEMKSPAVNLYAGENTEAAEAPIHQYKEKLLPLANITACCPETSIALMGELAVKFTYNTGNWCFDLGYNLWGRSGQKFCGKCIIPKNKYALKGDAFVIGFGATDATETTIRDLAIALSATESGADIHAGTNTPIGTDFVPLTIPTQATAHIRNLKVDNAELAWGAKSGSSSIQPVVQAHNADQQQNTSLQPEFLSSDLLSTNKTPSALSHKLFVHINYTWTDEMEKNRWTPFFGIGGSAEFASKRDGSYGTISQWAVWAKGGLAFD